MITVHLNGALDLQGMKQVFVMKALKECGGKVDGLSDKGVYLIFNAQSDVEKFEDSIRTFGGLMVQEV